MHAAGVISRLVCTRVFEPRVLFPLTGEEPRRAALPSAPLQAPIQAAPSHHPAASEPPRATPAGSPLFPFCLYPPLAASLYSPFARLSLSLSAAS